MKVETIRFGVLDVDDDSIITMPRGPLGFENKTRFVTIQHRADTGFRWLQCVDDSALAFVVVDPSGFVPEYDIEISDADVEKLQLESDQDAFIFAIVTVGESGQEVTANLAAPIVINSKTMTGMQVILQDSHYAVRHPLVERARSSSETRMTVKAA
ncbi:MAG: flagellar assembly protein FliW [Armatimonadota bacterium]